MEFEDIQMKINTMVREDIEHLKKNIDKLMIAVDKIQEKILKNIK